MEPTAVYLYPGVTLGGFDLVQDADDASHSSFPMTIYFDVCLGGIICFGSVECCFR